MKMTFITPSREIVCPRFVREFSSAGLETATLEITGLGLYRAYLNGERVGAEYLTPGFNDYDAYLRCRRYDVTALLKERNRLEVYVGDGWYKGRFGLEGMRGIWGERYLLAARLTLRGQSGERVIETDESWRASSSMIVESSIYDGETRDDTLPEAELVPCVRVETDYALEPDETPPVRCVATLKPTLILSPKGEQILDFGQNMVGVVRFVNRSPKESRIHMLFGEVLQNGCFYRDNLRSAKAEYTYVSDGVEKQVEPLFTFYGFRYALVEGVERVDPADYVGVVLSSDLRQTLFVETDNEKINRLTRNTLWGQRGNFVDVPTDCPQRDERLGWTADTQVFVGTACYQMDCKAFYAKYMRDMRIDQLRYYGGDIPMFSPSLKGAAGHGGAVWADAGTIIPWQVYLAYGDKTLLRENYPMMRDYAETLIARDAEQGGKRLIFEGFTFGDWLALDGVTEQSVKGGTDDGYINCVFYYHSIDLTSRAAEALGEAADAARYGAIADEIKQAILREFVTEGGRLAVDTQTAYILALHFGLYRDEQKIINGYRARMKRDGYRFKCGFTGAPLALPTLIDHGMADDAYRILFNERFPGWLYCVNLGATTIWERWNSLLPDGSISGTSMNSLNHYAYGAVCEAIYSRMAGLRAQEPGWKSALIAPVLNYRMRRMEIRFDSPAGAYRVKWQIYDDDTIRLEANVPEGARAKIILPCHPEGLIQEVSGGEYAYAYPTKRELTHPFSMHSRVMDVLDHAGARKVFMEKLPALHAAVSGEDSPFAGETLLDAANALPLADADAVRAADADFRGIRAYIL